MTSAPHDRIRWSAGAAQDGRREVPQEAPIALVHDATTTAVMMATPADLVDFGWGFTLTEGLATADQVTGVDVVTTDIGVEVRIWLEARAGAALAARRRRLTGPTGCGLCGIESLEEAQRPPPRVPATLRVTPDQLRAATDLLGPAQTLGAATRGAHAAALWTPDAGLVAIREDVGRHNALDKLAGAIARGGPARGRGVLLLTSRVSVEMVQKAAMMGVEVLAAVSVPTTLAIETAEAAGMTLVAVARADAFEVFTHPRRLGLGGD